MNPTDHSRTVDENTSDATFWYIWAEPKPLGPFLFKRLRQMAHQGRLELNARVRKGTSGDWVRAGDLTGQLFLDVADIPAAPPPTSVEEAATAKDASKNGPESLLSSIRNRVDDFVDRIRWGLEQHLGRIQKIVSWVALLGVFGTLTTVLWEQLSFDAFYSTDPLRLYYLVWDELKEKRQAATTTAEWDAFSERVRRELKPVVARLERKANSTDRLSQRLLWAGRDYLPKMLNDARHEESPSEKKFAELMQLSAWVASGNDSNGVEQGSGITLFLDANIAAAVFGVAFVAFDAGLVIWLVRRRRQRTSIQS